MVKTQTHSHHLWPIHRLLYSRLCRIQVAGLSAAACLWHGIRLLPKCPTKRTHHSNMAPGCHAKRHQKRTQGLCSATQVKTNDLWKLQSLGSICLWKIHDLGPNLQLHPLPVLSKRGTCWARSRASGGATAKHCVSVCRAKCAILTDFCIWVSLGPALARQSINTFDSPMNCTGNHAD